MFGPKWGLRNKLLQEIYGKPGRTKHIRCLKSNDQEMKTAYDLIDMGYCTMLSYDESYLTVRLNSRGVFYVKHFRWRMLIVVIFLLGRVIQFIVGFVIGRYA